MAGINTSVIRVSTTGASFDSRVWAVTAGRPRLVIELGAAPLGRWPIDFHLVNYPALANGTQFTIEVTTVIGGLGVADPLLVKHPGATSINFAIEGLAAAPLIRRV